jgi:hypothetical protein
MLMYMFTVSDKWKFDSMGILKTVALVILHVKVLLFVLALTWPQMFEIGLSLQERGYKFGVEN